MEYSDLHVHSRFSDGAHTVEEIVRAAAEKGLVSVGISDHSFTRFDLRYCMEETAVPAYLEEIRRVRDRYAGQIEVYAGMELDGYTELPDRSGFDYLIGDCHYVRTWDGYHSVDHAIDEQKAAIDAYFDGDPLAYAQAYYETFVSRTAAHRPDILGHFDVVSKFGAVDEEDPVYRRLAADALIACLEITPIVELNTGPLTRGWRNTGFPHAFLLKEVLAHGGRVILSSDAHDARNLAGCFGPAAEFLRSLGFTSHVVLRGGSFSDAAL